VLPEAGSGYLHIKFTALKYKKKQPSVKSTLTQALLILVLWKAFAN